MKTTITAILFLLTVQLTVSGQVTKTIEVATPGTLSSLLTESEKSTITDLTVTGNIDARDIKTMRDDITLLEVVNLSNTTIAEYTGTENGTAPSWYQNPKYPADVFPLYGFNNKNVLISIALPESITKIAQDALSSNANLETIIIGNQLLEIGSQVFYDAKKLSSIALPESLEIIGESSFRSCSGLNSLHIPASVVDIRESAFSGYCSAYITVDESNPNYSASDGFLFNKDYTILIDATTVHESYEVPESVIELGKYSFSANNKIKSITLPENLLTVSYRAFDGCTNLTTINCKAVNPPSVGDLAFRWVPKDGILYVPIGSRNAYMAANQWGEFQNIVETDFTTTIQAGKYQKPEFSTNNGRLYTHNVTSDMEVAVYNLTGQLISRFNTQQTNNIALPKGIYLVKAGDSCHKIIIK